MKQRITRAYLKLKETNIISNFFNLSSIQVSNILLMLLTIRLVTGRVGLEGFGMISYAYRFSILAGAIVNYGTNQSGVRDIALHRGDKKAIGYVLSQALVIRAIAFLVYITLLLLFYLTASPSANYLVLAAPIVFAEVINPLAFFMGAEKLRMFNICNLIANVLVLVAIYVIIKTPERAAWFNFIVGAGNIITYTFLLLHFFKAFGARLVRPAATEIKQIAVGNFHLVINGICTNLQQSAIIFMLNWYNPGILGAYSLADRIMAQCRVLFVIISNAIFPKAAVIYQNNAASWAIFRKKLKYTVAISALIFSLVIFVCADWITFLLSGKPDAMAALLLRVISFVLILTAFNVFSVIDLLLKKQNLYLSSSSLILALFSVVAAFFIARSNNSVLTGAFTIIIEGFALLIYEYKVRQPELKSA